MIRILAIKHCLNFFFSLAIQAKDKYERSSFGYDPYKINSKIGFYTEKYCKINIDHVVSLKDAFDSGAYKWSTNKKKKFSNDRSNHVSSCYKINSSKGSATPKHFLRRSDDGKGLEYKIISFCKYITIYYATKLKYNLSFKNNDPNLFARCGLKIN